MRFALMAAAAALLGSVGVANAADLSKNDGSFKDEPAAYSPLIWTGFYAGIHAGAGFGNFDVADPDGFNSPDFGVDAKTFGIDDQGFIGGIQLGYNWQAGSLVLGVEGELGYMGINAKGIAPDGDVEGDSVANYESDLYATLAARLGFAYGNALIYAKGGVALLNVDTSFTSSKAGFFDDVALKSSPTSETLTGWVLGGGVEYALSDGWSLKAEYLHFKFEDVSVNGTDDAENAYRFNFDGNVDTVKVGLNYQFGSREESLK